MITPDPAPTDGEKMELQVSVIHMAFKISRLPSGTKRSNYAAHRHSSATCLLTDCKPLFERAAIWSVEPPGKPWREHQGGTFSCGQYTCEFKTCVLQVAVNWLTESRR